MHFTSPESVKRTECCSWLNTKLYYTDRKVDDADLELYHGYILHVYIFVKHASCSRTFSVLSSFSTTKIFQRNPRKIVLLKSARCDKPKNQLGKKDVSHVIFVIACIMVAKRDVIKRLRVESLVYIPWNFETEMYMQRRMLYVRTY